MAYLRVGVGCGGIRGGPGGWPETKELLSWEEKGELCERRDYLVFLYTAFT